MKLLLNSAFVLLCAGAAGASTINGDFETGDLTGYSQVISGASGEPVEDFVDVKSSGSNNFVQLSTGLDSQGLSIARISQSITITAEKSYLTFDTKLISRTGSAGGGSGFIDNVSLGIFDANFDRSILYSYTFAGEGIDPFNETYAGLFSNATSSYTSVIAPSSSEFTTGVAADLSQFIGETFTLILFASSFNDGASVTAAFDNIQLSAQPHTGGPTPVPLPASLPLLLASLGGVGLIARRRKAAD